MKKSILALLIAAQLVVAAPRAHAVAYAVFTPWQASIVLVALAGFVATKALPRAAKVENKFERIFATAVTLLGVVALKNDGQKAEFQALTAEKASALNIDASEMEAYNDSSNLNRLNALVEEVTSRVAHTPVAEQEQVAAALWAEARANQELPELVFNTVSKILSAN
jgi:hypothetical protein